MDKERQIYQLHQKGYEDIAKAITKKPAISLVIEGEGIEKIEVESPKGDPGIDGKPGKNGVTPTKGVDYFTSEEVDSITKDILKSIPKPKDGIDGKDAVVDYERINKFVRQEVAKIPKPKDGADGFTPKIDYESITAAVLKKIPAVDYPAIYEHINKQVERVESTRTRGFNSAGPTTRLEEMSNVKASLLQVGYVLVWNGSEWVPTVMGGSGSSITLKTNGTNNGLQSILNLKQGTNVTIADDGVGGVTINSTAGGSGTVTSASVVSANGFAGTVATATTTPAITLSTTVTGLLKGNGTAISTATAGTDYIVPTSSFTAGSVAFGGSSGQLSQDNANLFFDDANNRLGIGTASPGAELVVNGTVAAGQVGVSVNNSNTSGYSVFRIGTAAPAAVGMALHQFNSAYSGTGAYSASATTLSAFETGGLNLQSNTANPIRFYVGGSGTANEVAQFNANGYLGLGTNNPQIRLHIVENRSGAGLFRAQNSNTGGYTGFELYGSGGTQIGAFGVGGSAAAVFANEMYFGTSSANNFRLMTTNTTRMTITSGGDVQIPTVGTSATSVMTTEGVQTVKNKRNAKRVVITTQSATPTINTDNTDIAQITGLAQAITSMTTNLSGTPLAGDMLMIQITDNGTARAITWGSSFASTTVTLPTTTAISTMLRVLFQRNNANTAWDCISTV